MVRREGGELKVVMVAAVLGEAEPNEGELMAAAAAEIAGDD